MTNPSSTVGDGGAPKTKTKRAKPKVSATSDSENLSKLIAQYGGSAVHLTGGDNALYERHPTFDNVVAIEDSGPAQQYEAFARSIRDVLSQRWIRTEQTYDRENPSGLTTCRWSS